MALLKKLAWRDQSWAPQKGPTPIVELEKTRPTRVQETTDSAHMLLGPVLGGGTGPFGGSEWVRLQRLKPIIRPTAVQDMPESAHMLRGPVLGLCQNWVVFVPSKILNIF